MPHCHAIRLHRAGPPHGGRRLLGRLRALVLGVVIGTLILVGERWLLVEAPLAGTEVGLAVRSGNQGNVRGADPAVRD